MSIPETSHVRTLLAERMGRATPIIETIALHVDPTVKPTSLVIHVRSDDGRYSRVVEFLGRKLAADLRTACLLEGLHFDGVVFQVTSTQALVAADADVVYRRAPVMRVRHIQTVDELVAFLSEDEDLV